MDPILDGQQAKYLARALCDTHRKFGASALTADGRDAKEVLAGTGLKMVNLSKEGDLDGVPGVLLNPHKVRTFLWENRRKRALCRANMVIWSAVVDNMSFIGLGAIVTPKVADRFKGRKVELD